MLLTTLLAIKIIKQTTAANKKIKTENSSAPDGT
jgi:hypothetical protein